MKSTSRRRVLAHSAKHHPLGGDIKTQKHTDLPNEKTYLLFINVPLKTFEISIMRSPTMIDFSTAMFFQRLLFDVCVTGSPEETSHFLARLALGVAPHLTCTPGSPVCTVAQIPPGGFSPPQCLEELECQHSISTRPGFTSETEILPERDNGN